MRLTLISYNEQPYTVLSRVLTLFYITYRSYSHQSLTNLGIAAALITGLIHSLPPSNLPLILIVTFFITSTAATNYKHGIKSKKTKMIKPTSSNATSSKRTHIQVFCNSGIGSILILLSVFVPDYSEYSNFLTVGIITQYSCAIADTWSSEMGILSTSNPYLITSLKQVPPGTNGGVSTTGLVFGISGSFIISLISVMCINVETRLKHLIFFTIVGFSGTLIDSILGSLFQCSAVGKDGLILESMGGQVIEYSEIKEEIKVVAGSDILSNNSVNILTGLLTVLLGIGCYGLVF